MKKIIVFLIIVALFVTGCGKRADSQYLQAAQEALNSYSLAVAAWDARIDEFEADPSLLRDTAWAQESLSLLGDLQKSASAFRELPEVSTNQESLHTLLLSAADSTDSYVDTMTSAINNLDENLVETARRPGLQLPDPTQFHQDPPEIEQDRPGLPRRRS